MTAAAPSTRLRAIVVDDDASARERLRQLIGTHADVRIVAECDGGRAAVAAVQREQPNLVFLDVEMPDLDGFGVISEVGARRMPLIIFTSAYSEYAVRAFEAYALDYLLKPFDGARLAAAVDRAREWMQQTERGADERVSGLLTHRQSRHWHRYPESIAVRSGDGYAVIPLAAVDWIEADGSYGRIWVQRHARLIGKSLAALELDVLDPELFLRVHRSAIVNVKKIARIESDPHGDAVLVLHDGSRVPCSRRYRDRLKAPIYFST